MKSCKTHHTFKYAVTISQLYCEHKYYKNAVIKGLASNNLLAGVINVILIS